MQPTKNDQPTKNSREGEQKISLQVDISKVLLLLNEFHITASEGIKLLEAIGYSKSEKHSKNIIDFNQELIGFEVTQKMKKI